MHDAHPPPWILADSSDLQRVVVHGLVARSAATCNSSSSSGRTWMLSRPAIVNLLRRSSGIASRLPRVERGQDTADHSLERGFRVDCHMSSQHISFCSAGPSAAPASRTEPEAASAPGQSVQESRGRSVRRRAATGRDTTAASCSVNRTQLRCRHWDMDRHVRLVWAWAREDPIQPEREVPVRRAQERHPGWDEDETHNGCVESDGRG